MPTFKIDSTRVDEFEVDVDDSLWTPETIQDWAKTFYEADSPQDIAKYAADAIMRRGTDPGFIEGFGYVKILRHDGTEITQFGGDPFRALTDGDYCAGVVVKVISLDEDVDMDVRIL